MLNNIDFTAISGKTVLLRLDLNMPVDENNYITDYSRLEHSIETMKELRRHNAKIVILSHKGRPKHGYTQRESLKNTAPIIENYLNEPVKFLATNFTDNFPTRHEITGANIFLLENLRFSSHETDNSPTFAQRLALLGDMYVNDAFSVSHRSHTSVDAITRYLTSYAGLAFTKEVQALSLLHNNHMIPSMVIIGGAKISTKISILENLVSRVNILFIGGAMANNFLKVQGHTIGASLYEDTHLTLAEDIMKKANALNTELILPHDVIVATNTKTHKGQSRILTDASIFDNEMILDIGPLTINHLCNVIQRTNMVLWNGPLGLIEKPPFAQGSETIARFVAEQVTKKPSFKAIAGGGDTGLLLQNAGVKDKFSYVSNAGGAFLEWLEGKTLPGIRALQTIT